MTREHGGAKAKGFTLIELLVTMLIAAILAAVAIPAYQLYIAKQKVSVSESDLVSLSMNMENYLQNNTQYPTALASLAGWTPASQDFTYALSNVVQPTATAMGSYTLTATGATTLVSGCTVTLTSANIRSLSGCPGGATAW